MEIGMTFQQVLMLLVLVALVIGMLRAYKWLCDGGMYYRQYPGAKLMDDMAAAGQLDESAMNEIIERVGSAKDQLAVVAEIRAERGLSQSGK